MKEFFFKKKKEIIFFEEILPVHRWIICFYLLRQKEIYFIRLNRFSENKEWVKSLVAKSSIRRIDFKDRFCTPDGIYYDLAFDNIDYFFDSIKENRVIKGLTELYGNENLILAFKKGLNERLARFYYINYALDLIQKRYPDKRIKFIPHLGLKILYKSDGCEIYDYPKLYRWARQTKARYFDTKEIKFALWTKGLSYINAAKRKIKIALRLIGFLSWCSLKSVKPLFMKSGACPGPTYKHAIMIISPERQFANRIQKVDFLLDDKLLKKESTIFISCNKLNAKNRKYLENNHLAYTDTVDRFVSRKEIKKILPIWFWAFMSLFKGKISVSETAVKVMYFYLRWESFSKNIKIKHLITHSDFGIQSIVRNIILERRGCRTYYYMDTIHFAHYRVKKDGKNKFRHNLLGFLYYDYFIGWSNSIFEYFRESGCLIKNYIDLGCFWSEHLELIEKREMASDFKNCLRDCGYHKGIKLVSVFDSGLHDSFMATYQDGIKFLEGISKLLDDLPDIFVVLKEKKPRNYHQKISHRFRDMLGLLAKLEEHPRCHCIKNSWENSSEVMVFSDLVISFPFTSTTFEAISAKKKAVWYDATDKYRNTFYDDIPGLVCHSYNELLERTKNLLDMDDSNYDIYLEDYIKGNIENHLDCKAITRFRQLLANNRNAASRFKVNHFEFVGKKK